MRYAVDRNWLKSAPAIHNESERLARRRRRHFTIEEYRKLYRTARKQAKELDGVELKTVQSWQRKLLRDYVLILANTGLRVDEAKTLVCVNGGDKSDHLAAQIRAIERAPSGMTRALQIACACHGALARRSNPATGDQTLASAFRARLRPSL